MAESPTPDFALSTFTATEAAEITGVSAMLQRDWRNRGFLPTFEGHARYTLGGLAKLKVMGAMAGLGIGPKAGQLAATECAACIATIALLWVEAWSDDRPKSADLHKAVHAELRKDPHLRESQNIGAFPASYFVFTSLGHTAWVNVLTDIDGNQEFDDISRAKGMAIISYVDVMAFAYDIIKKAGKRLIYLPPNEVADA